jgi:hypothetical protein
MTTHVDIGMNRTGVATSPRLSSAMVKGMEEFNPSIEGDGAELASVRTSFARAAEPLGHVPPPVSLKGVAAAAVQAIKGEAPALFIDKIGERLGFERMGVRLYEAALTKLDAVGGFAGGPARDELEAILEEEYAHFQVLREAATSLGADPTVLTPSADLQATLGRGVLDVLVDARTKLPQCLEALLVAELADNDSWQALLELAQQASHDALSERFATALEDEERHLRLVRGWVAAAQGRK